MSNKESTVLGRWCGMLAGALLLALCLILVSGQQATAQDGPPPYGPAFERPTSTVPRGPAVQSKPQVVQDLESQPASFLNQPQVNPGFTVDLLYNAVWGVVDSGKVVTVTRTGDGAYGAAEVNDKGFFWTPLWQATGQPADIADGDTIEIYVDGSLEATIPVVGVGGGIDVLADEVDGAIPNGIAGTPVTVTIGLEGGQPPSNAPQATAATDPAGSFTAAFAGMDLGASNLAAVEYASGGGRVRAYLYPNDRVFEAWNMRGVRGYADPGQQVDVTVYEGAGPTVRWSGNGAAGEPHGFYDIGLSGPGSAEAAQPGDLVAVDLGGGEVLSTTIAGLGITGVDPALDQIQGTAPAGETVVVRLWQEGGYAQTTATAGGGGAFTADLSGIADLRPRDTIRVALAVAEGDESLLQSGAPHQDVYLDPLSPNDCVVWRVDGPFLPITLTLQTSTGVYTRENPIGPSDAGNSSGPFCYLVRGPDWGPIDFAPGDTVTLRSPTWVGSMVIPDITWSVNTADDQVSGEAPPGEVVVTVRDWSADRYPVGGWDTQSTTVASPYTVSFLDFDVRDGGTVDVHYYEPGSDFGAWYYGWGNLQYHYFEVYPWGVGGIPPQADEHVTAYLYDSDGTTLLAWTDNDQDGAPWRFWFGDWQGYSIEAGYWLTVTADSGWTAGLQVPLVTVDADTATDLIWGEAPKSSVLVEHEWSDGWDGRWVAVDGYVLDRAYFGGDLQNGNRVYATYQHPNGDRVRAERTLGEVIRAEFWFELDSSTSMWGEAQPGSTVTVTTPLTQVYAYADPACNGCWDVYVGQLYPGDNVSVVAGAGNDPVNLTVPDPLSAEADSGPGNVWGQIGGWYSQTVEVHGNWGDGYQEVTTDLAGNYLAHYDNMPRGADGYIRFVDQYNYTQVVFHRHFRSPDLLLNVNYAHDWVEGNYEPGHTVWITLTQSDGVTIKDTAVLTTGQVPWWGGQTGFSTSWQGWSSGGWPDLQTGDWVYGLVDNGYSSEVKIGTIEGALDLDNDSIAGNIWATWFTQTLNAWCSVWEENGPGADFQVDPDGGAYFCDFGALGWDLLPGHDVGVGYFEPDGDQVMNVFREPAPNMRVEKWAEGSGQAMSGGPVVFTLRYRNEGDAEATTIYLTDTLPVSTTYVADGSGVAPTTGPGWVAWTLGPLPAGEERQFQLVLNNTANPGDTLHNVADIWALYDDDYDNNHAEADVQVVEGQPDMYVNKNPNPGDPAPGQTMLWEINYGNNGPVASGQVVLTDTIPQDTSLVDWFSGNGYNLWVDNSTAGQLILEAPTVPGNWGDTLYLRLLVDGGVPVGTQLTNTVAITATNDSDPGNNWHMRNDVWTNWPRWDSFVDKSFGWGRLVPGGQMEYNLHARNGGNMPAYTVVTDTLPAGTSFDQSWSCMGPTCVPFPPDYVDDQIAVWDLGMLEPGEWVNFNLRVDIDASVEPGTVLTNCAEVAIDGDDSWPYNNTDCVTRMIHDVGPNLEIDKYYQWNWEGQLEYTIEFRNLGTTTLHNVEITDTLPDGTAFSGNWWHSFWEGIDFSQVGNQLIWTISRLDPTWSSSLRYQVDLDDDLVGVEGLCFVNAAEAPLAGDIWPDDNSDEVAACTGPDVYVEKWLSGGEPKVGETVTFTVQFGNQDRWPWNGDDQYGSHITDTLPTGMTFITATAPWDPDDRWQPERVDGNTIVWGWGTMWADNWWRFDIVAQITGPVEDGDVLVNTVEAYGDSPDDVEPDYDNNVFQLPLMVLAPEFQVNKIYDTTGLTGAIVTYTLTVENVGSLEATHVVLSDTLPSGLTYGGGDGTFDGTDVTWTITSIAAGDSATAWFWATLPDEEGTVTNDAYRVVGSDQGIASAFGPAVSFPVTAANYYVYLPIVLKNHTP
jgi:uncharacterized repeat protein (TIGR01451 family)